MKVLDAPAKMSKLRSWRLGRGFSLNDVAALSGYAEPTLSLAELGKRRLSARAKVHLARSVGARVSDLFDPDPMPSD